MSTDVHIRRCEIHDTQAVYGAIIESRPELSAWMSWCHEGYSLQDARLRMESRQTAWDQNQEWDFVVLDAQGSLLGTCGIHRIDLRNGTAELGYWVRTSATRQGVATEATKQVCRWAFTEKGIHRVEILSSVENLASQRVAEKAGGVREGILRERILLHGRRHDCVLFAIVNRQS